MTYRISGYDVLLDSTDGWLVERYKYTVQAASAKFGRFYFARNVWVAGRRTTAKLHRDIMGCVVGDGRIVDHKDGNTLDNRKENLRFSTHAENCRNQRRNTLNTSGTKGVRWYAPGKKWQARISVNNVRVSLGYFKDIADAEKAYAEGSKKYHGEFGRTK